MDDDGRSQTKHTHYYCDSLDLSCFSTRQLDEWTPGSISLWLPPQLAFLAFQSPF